MSPAEPLAARHHDALVGIVGADHVITDPDRLAAHTVDWTRRWVGATPAVVRPGSTDEVRAVVRYAAANQLALVPQGGNTGMVGGSVPLGGELVLHLGRLAAIEDLDPVGAQLTAGAGATLAQVQAAAATVGRRYGVDLGARDTATVGGTIATNAGGINVLRHGDTRRQVLGVEAVTGAGEVVGDLRGLLKDNTGYHLPSLLCGSEGTLAVVTRARLRLVAAPADTAVAIVGFDDLDAAMAQAMRLRDVCTDLSAIELFLDDGLALVCAVHGLARPVPHPSRAYLLVEAAGAPGVLDRLVGALAGSARDDATAVADDRSGREALWRYREAHTESIATVGIPHKLDVTVPLRYLAAFADDVRAAVRSRWPDAAVWLFGHAGDGNLHVNVTGPAPDDDEVDRVVLELVAAAGGSISAEHGIGRAKARWLGLNRTPDELALAARLRAAFDPAGILNPGVLAPGRDER